MVPTGRKVKVIPAEKYGEEYVKWMVMPAATQMFEAVDEDLIASIVNDRDQEKAVNAFLDADDELTKLETEFPEAYASGDDVRVLRSTLALSDALGRLADAVRQAPGHTGDDAVRKINTFRDSILRAPRPGDQG